MTLANKVCLLRWVKSSYQSQTNFQYGHRHKCISGRLLTATSYQSQTNFQYGHRHKCISGRLLTANKLSK